MQTTADCGGLGPTDTCVAQTLHLRLWEEHRRRGRKTLRARGLGCGFEIVISISDGGAASMRSQQYGGLGKAETMTIPVDMPTWMGEMSLLDDKLQATNDC